MSVGTNIKLYRELSGYMQEDVAYYIGKSRGVVSQYENDITSPPIGVIKKLAELFNVSPCVLIDENNLSVPDELCTIYDSLNQRARAKLMEYARDLAANPVNGKKCADIQESIA